MKIRHVICLFLVTICSLLLVVWGNAWFMLYVEHAGWCHPNLVSLLCESWWGEPLVITVSVLIFLLAVVVNFLIFGWAFRDHHGKNKTSSCIAR